MFHRFIKLIIVALLVACSIWRFYEGEIGNGIFLIIISIIPLFLYFKNEFIFGIDEEDKENNKDITIIYMA